MDAVGIKRKKMASGVKCVSLSPLSTLLPETLATASDLSVATFHIAGWKTCPSFVKAQEVAAAMQMLYPDRVAFEAHPFEDRDAFKQWLGASQDDITASFGTGSDARNTYPTTFVGGCDNLLAFFRSGIAVGKPQGVTPNEEPATSYDYDLVVIGGGSGGLACSKEAASFGQKVCVLDYVKPSPQGTSWGLGGTCSSLIGEVMHHDSANFGWKVTSGEGGAPTFDWKQLVANVDGYIKGINFKYKVELRSKYVKYENFLGSFIDPHTLELWHPRKGTKQITTRNVVIAVGGRPKELTCRGGEYAISSDDIFWMKKKEPGKTLVVGASYVALECAGFLKGMGYDVKVMVRSILLRGFDQDMANKIGEYMEVQSGIEFIRKTVPQSITKLENGQLLVKWTSEDGESCEEAFDTVLNATGRDPDVAKLGLDKAGVKLNDKTGRIWVKNEQTSTSNIYAIGDVIDAPELTPVAIQAGRFLSRRLYNNSTVQMDYEKVCTAVFTPIEYGCCGLSEEDSKDRYGEGNIEVYHTNFVPLEWSLSTETRTAAESCYVKVICDKTRDKFVVGFHYLGPNAGEVTQAMGLAMKLGFTYDQMVDTVGIHPTTAESFTTLELSVFYLPLLLALLAACVTGQRRLDAGLGEGQVVLHPPPFFVVDGLDFQGMALAYLQEQGINTSIEAQSWMQQHGYTSLRAMLDDESLYKVTEEAIFECGLTSPKTETQPIPTNNSFQTSGYTLDGPCEVWLDDTKVASGRNCHSEFPHGQHQVDYSSCGEACTLAWYWLGIKYVEGIYSWQVYKNCVGLSKTATA
ncbi:FAD/NAD(P)-binding domain [Phytophthora cactorum]|nr:FAD/NAD(P)-binding domain [Phytophthora cactorum]